ncbi:L-carnitine dehydratase/bile acid-inducible protein F [Ancylobacter novellus DSM 506]|uniref:L-carnitine dehydratase/bile acid-inducible protein F n=1 Tax=Ancylobacter novellus (strain ATCC 8093 / DSM 506 / JCM 20403 / CCM 1077 / IAM 12100 / NBRC 12443 / NCIMB 10456) TaxID=639283 RepID=D7AA07_ANCN5|nr:CoA transferase [Ancylobacter novellus]ADH90794.1 L-carnitine dehydratase/bile acid-inducible protein F [Ancylobacter novellus DSM 506]
MNPLSLDGIRIVDFSWVMAGPMTTKMLGAMGAEVVKIESASRPEFSVRDGMFSVINNNKKSCTLNITTPEGQDLIRELVKSSHVVVENFSSRVLVKYGLSYDVLREIKPDIIFVSASGMGRTGPEKDLLAYGSLLQGYSGRVGMIGEPNPALEAMGILPAWTDPITALWETTAILSAIRHWRQTGQGAYVDLSMLEATVALLPEALLHAALGREVPERRSVTETGAAPSGCFRCAGEDSWLALSVRTEEEWRGLCRVMNDADLAGAPFTADAASRLAAKDELNARVASWLRGQDARAVEAALHAAGVPASRSRDMGEIVADPHMRERAMFREIDGEVQMATLPWLAADKWRGAFSPTPPIGRDNDYVFGTLLGLSSERRAELAEAGTIR